LIVEKNSAGMKKCIVICRYRPRFGYFAGHGTPCNQGFYSEILTLQGIMILYLYLLF